MPSTPDRTHVVAAAIVDGKSTLVARRQTGVHQGGLWEFPGGKLEPGESRQSALAREIEEELGIEVTRARPLIRIPHDYDDARVLLDVWWVDSWKGEPHGKEGQTVEWCSIDTLESGAFPAANRAIITAVQLPAIYLITPEPSTMPDQGLGWLEDRLRQGRVGLVQLRSKRLAERDYHRLTNQVARLCADYGAKVLVNTDPGLALQTQASGVHLTARRLRDCSKRPLDPEHLVGASCHNGEELAHACRIGVDFAVLSPVAKTRSHPHATPMGWEVFRELVETATMPVYALGGMQLNDIDTAWEHGAQGIATISGLSGKTPASIRKTPFLTQRRKDAKR